MKKVLVAFIITFSLLLTLGFKGTSAVALEEVVINGSKVYYNYTGNTVKVPVEYVVDSSEMRGAWVATVWNNDVPKQKGTTEAAIEEYKAFYLDILDTLESYNMNTIFFQVRPNNDAFYESEYNDWSEFLVGRGVNPGWDPLEWMIEVTHERDMYFQCWMNAFRVTVQEQFPDNDASAYSHDELIARKKAAIENLSEKNFAKQHPEYVLMGDYDSKLILNPAEPAVHEHLLNTIGELITKYDVDGFHFDDYFYLDARSADGIDPQLQNLAFAGGIEYNSKLTGENIMNDLPTYKDYQENPSKYDLPEGLTLGEFRRKSLNNLMKSIRELVDSVNKQYDKDVEFGSKPAAVWQSNSEYCLDSSNKATEGGSNTHCGSYTSNYDLFADTKYWVEAGYVDWISPQVYYDFANRIVPYADIVSWWADVVVKTNEKREAEGLEPIKMYVAHGIYKYHASSSEYNDTNEVTYQMRYNQLFDVIKGSAVYAYSDLYIFQNDLQKFGVGNYFRQLWVTHPVLPLPKDEIDFTDLELETYKVKDTGKNNVYDISFPKVENASMYAIYRINKGETLDLNDTRNRISIVKDYKFTDNVNFTVLCNENQEVYIQVVSDNYIPQNTATKIDVSLASINQAPEPVEITINNGEDVLDANGVFKFSFPYAFDADEDKLTYTVKVGFNGKDGSINTPANNIEYLEDKIVVTFEAFGIETENFVVQLTISDGRHTVVVYSKEVKLSEDVTDTPKPPVHKHEYVDGECACGAKDPNYEEHVHEFINGECECGEIDPNYKAPSTGGGSSCQMGAMFLVPMLAGAAILLIKKRR